MVVAAQLWAIQCGRVGGGRGGGVAELAAVALPSSSLFASASSVCLARFHGDREQKHMPFCATVLSRSCRPINGLKARCLMETGSDKGRVSVSTEDDINVKDEEAVSHINGRSGVLMHNPDENTEADSYLDFGEDENEALQNVEISDNGGIVGEETLPRVQEALGTAVADATEKVVEVASSTTFSVEVVAETVEVAAQTVSNVGEIESALLVEEAPVADKAAALKTVAFWVGAAVTFGSFVGFREGTGKASEFFAGYLLEQSLSVDNLFVFVLIFNYFKVPFEFQSRVLTYGIAGAVVFRALMIGLGIASLQKFEGLNLIFAAILVFSSFKLVAGDDDGEDDLSDNFIVNLCRKFIPVTSAYDGNKFLTTVGGVKKATPLLLTLVIVELSDIAFAVDSIPAVFGVTRDPLIVYSSNIFAILGLRSLYTIISGNMGELEYLQPSVGIVLGFIGGKMIGEFFGLHLPTEASLGVVGLVLGSGIGLSLLERSKEKKE
ncbi:unnamed protein product [Calypogeia fissa]